MSTDRPTTPVSTSKLSATNTSACPPSRQLFRFIANTPLEAICITNSQNTGARAGKHCASGQAFLAPLVSVHLVRCPHHGTHIRTGEGNRPSIRAVFQIKDLARCPITSFTRTSENLAHLFHNPHRPSDGSTGFFLAIPDYFPAKFAKAASIT